MALLVKTLEGLAYASVKEPGGLAVASIKTINGLDVTSAGGSPELIAHAAAGGTANGVGPTSGIVTTGANLLVVAVASYPPGGELTVTDSYGNTWTPATGFGDSLTRIQFFYCFGATVGSGHTFSASAALSWAGLPPLQRPPAIGSPVPIATSIHR